MLVLGRKVGETIHIGQDIEVTITAIEGDVVKLGIRASKSVPVHRQEVFEEIRKENQAASASLEQLKKFTK
ncbi:carbon storage regulator [Tetzosporium hominis]|uniref:Translational regulator CsrA n=1 Tax=Tetzosporium hominis TaxID=2020506 RepID=A0A264W4A5_9BACL|nr:carbon storage regulator CsrA [Tetzosporium hominis]OZS78416.1 carbon storage regulator [Tetzosporium hominis]